MFTRHPKYNGMLSNIGMAAMLLFTTLSPLACGTAKPAAKSEFLELLRQNNRISISLSAVMTFNDHGRNVTAPGEFSVQDVPITWEATSRDGTTFSGNISYPDRHITDSVHGVVTADGKWLEHIAFWRDIKAGATESTFQIELGPVPVVDIAAGNVTRVGICEKTGDVRKYVQEITYLPGGITWVPTDLQSGAQPPVMKVRFDK